MHDSIPKATTTRLYDDDSGDAPAEDDADLWARCRRAIWGWLVSDVDFRVTSPGLTLTSVSATRPRPRGRASSPARNWGPSCRSPMVGHLSGPACQAAARSAEDTFLHRR